MALIDTIINCIHINKPLLIVGPSGSGKSITVHEAAAALNLRVIDLRLALLDPCDARGLPVINRDADGCGAGVAWAEPDFITESRLTPEDKAAGIVGVILFIDEITCAAPAVQNAILQLILDRRVGPHRLGDNCYIISACNKAEHGAYATPLSAPLRNRFIIINHEPDVEEWTQWAFANGVNKDVIGFIQWRPQALYSLPKDDYAPFAAPRSWETVSDLLHTLCKDGANPVYIRGAVGSGAAEELFAYIDEIQYMPNINDLIRGKETYTHNPGKPSITYAIIVNLVYRVIKDIKLMDKAGDVATKLGSEFESIFFSNVLQGCTPEDQTTLFINKQVRVWSNKNGYRTNTALVF